MTNVHDTLSERAATHGDFRENARVSQALKRVFEATPAWARLDDVSREALELIAFKASRILTGGGQGPAHADNWRDIAGYATLAELAIDAPTLPVIVPTPAAVSEASKPALAPIQEAPLYKAPAPAAPTPAILAPQVPTEVSAPFQGAPVAEAPKPVVKSSALPGGPVAPLKAE
jgi:hypothetical protein